MTKIVKNILITIATIIIFTSTIFPKTEYVSQLDKNFKFTNQDSTGKYSYDNCSVTSMYMIFQLLDIKLGLPEDIRSDLKNQSGWVYTNEIEKYLNRHEVIYYIRQIKTKEDMVDLLKNDKILLLCLDLSKLSYKLDDSTVNNRMVGKSRNGTGHFIGVSGYYLNTDDNVEYLEVLDSLNYEVRYYSLDEVYESVMSWWGWGFVFSMEFY